MTENEGSLTAWENNEVNKDEKPKNVKHEGTDLPH